MYKNKCHLCKIAFLVIYPRVQEGHFPTALCCAPFTRCCFSAPLAGEGQTVYSHSGNRLQTLINHSKITGLNFNFLPRCKFCRPTCAQACNSGNKFNDNSVVMKAEGGEVIKSDPALRESTHKTQIKMGHRSGCSH